MYEYIDSVLLNPKGYEYRKLYIMVNWPEDRKWWKMIIRYLMIAVCFYLGWPGVKSIVVGLWIRVPYNLFIKRLFGSYDFRYQWHLLVEIMMEYYTSGPVYFVLSHLGKAQGIVTFLVKWIGFRELWLFVNAYLYIDRGTMAIPEPRTRRIGKKNRQTKNCSALK